jgi:hypothetical protein
VYPLQVLYCHILDTPTIFNSSESLQVSLQESQKKGGLQVVYKWQTSVNMGLKAHVTIPTQSLQAACWKHHRLHVICH